MSTKQRRPGSGPEASTDSLAAGSTVRPAPAGVLLRAEVARILARIDVAEPVRRRVVQEALSDALAMTWRRKADLYLWACSRPGEYTGNASPEELAQRDRKLAAQAQACRHKAELLELRLLDDDLEGVSDVR